MGRWFLDKKMFHQHAKDILENVLCSKLNVVSLSLKDVEIIVNLVFESILRVISSGDEVRLTPIGVFYPKLVRNNGKIVSVKLDFDSFAKTNNFIFDSFKRLPIFNKMTDNSGVTIETIGRGGIRVFDKNGNELFNIAEIAKMAGISSPTMHKYMTRYGSEIECVENYTNKKYNKQVAEFFKKVKGKNLNNVKAVTGNVAIEIPEKASGKYTLSEVSRMAGISMITLYKYLDKYSDRLSAFVIVEEGGKVKKRSFLKEFIVECIEIKKSNFSKEDNG